MRFAAVVLMLVWALTASHLSFAEASPVSERPTADRLSQTSTLLRTSQSFSTDRSPVVTLASSSLTDRSIHWPDWAQWKRVLLLRDYNTRVVILGTMLLGLAAGIVGSFTLLRRRALMGDALSHATLPGVGLVFLIAPWFGLDGKSLPVLLTGAALSGIVGVAAILYVRNMTRLKEDAALGIVLSVFFGAGISILTVIQQLPTGHAAGLESFIYGKTASMIASDAWLIAWSGLFTVVVIGLMFKELTLLCFDDGFAGSRGYPVVLLDLILMGLVVIVTIIGLQAVGLVLMIALLVIPAAAARFWTQSLNQMTLISAGIGAFGGLVGSGMSAVFPNLPSGAMIVLICSSLFFASMLFGTARGVLVRAMRRRELNRSVDHQHLLRGLFELLESRQPSTSSPSARPPAVRHDENNRQASGISFLELLAIRSWSPYRLTREIERCRRAGFVVRNDDATLALTSAGLREASRLVHEHRLWELYLITHADVAPGRVDQSADAIEHVLEPELIAQLENLLRQDLIVKGVAHSPHPIDQAGGSL